MTFSTGDRGPGKDVTMAVTRLEEVAALLLGSIAGSMAGALMVRAGVKPEVAAAATAVGGVAVALASSGETRLAGAGAAAAGAGQLALAFLQREQELAAMRNAAKLEYRSALARAIEDAFDPSEFDEGWRHGQELARAQAEVEEDELAWTEEVTGSAEPGVRIPDSDTVGEREPQ